MKLPSARFRALLVLGLAAAVSSAAGSPAPRIRVAAGEPLQRIVDSVVPGTTIDLGPGVHAGPIIISRALSLEGTDRTVLAGPLDTPASLSIAADDVAIRDLSIIGGASGIEAYRSEHLVIEDVAVRGAELHGIHVVGGSARIARVSVADLKDPFAQGIEVFDAPGSAVEHSSVVAGMEGIVTHLSHGVRVEANTVSDTTFRGIAVKEMSHARVAGNRVLDGAGVGFYCGDMSHCAFTDNRALGVTPRTGGRSSAGWGLVVHFHSVASTDGDSFAGAAGDVATFVGGRIAADSPLELGSGLRAIWQTLGLSGLGVAVLLLLYPGARRLARLLPDRDSGLERERGNTIKAALTAGLLIQTFHMAEHLVQVWRVRFDGVPSRGSLVGSVVDTEWVHFAYNLLVLAGLLAVLLLRARGWQPAGRAAVGDALLIAAAAVQSYHVVEHSGKVVQHLATGAKVNPGFLGGPIDLVWLHFVLNLAVYAGFLGAFVAYGLRHRAMSVEDPRITLSPATSLR